MVGDQYYHSDNGNKACDWSHQARVEAPAPKTTNPASAGFMGRLAGVWRRWIARADCAGRAWRLAPEGTLRNKPGQTALSICGLDNPGPPACFKLAELLLSTALLIYFLLT
jgi:hypothetical protein